MSTQTTADMRHRINTTDKDGNQMEIEIRLNDECKNGHQDFAITATVWEKGKPRNDRYFISGGCCHDTILEAHPELKIFVDLHLCDYLGIPMHCVANGFYFLSAGFNNTKPEEPNFKAEYCEYYRITPKQFDTLSQSRNQLQYALNLQSLGILAQWEKQAKEATKLLENMTGKTFVVNSRRTQFDAPTPEEIAAEQEKEKSGYYTPEAEAKRVQAAKDKLIEELATERDKALQATNNKFETLKQVAQIAGKLGLRNAFYYERDNSLNLDPQRSYEGLTPELLEKIKTEIKLPDGVKMIIK